MTKFIFAVSKDYENDTNVLHVTEREQFEQAGYVSLADPTDLEDSLEGFTEETEGIFYPEDPELTKTGIIELMESRGLEHHENFQEYVDGIFGD